MPKQTVDNLIINMKKQGFLEISSNPDDKREKYIILTKTGRNYAKSMVEPLINFDNKVVRTMGDDLYEKFVEVLNEYANALEKNI